MAERVGFGTILSFSYVLRTRYLLIFQPADKRLNPQNAHNSLRFGTKLIHGLPPGGLAPHRCLSGNITTTQLGRKQTTSAGSLGQIHELRPIIVPFPVSLRFPAILRPAPRRSSDTYFTAYPTRPVLPSQT